MGCCNLYVLPRPEDTIPDDIIMDPIPLSLVNDTMDPVKLKISEGIYHQVINNGGDKETATVIAKMIYNS